jgi:hypothetical protein
LQWTGALAHPHNRLIAVSHTILCPTIQNLNHFEGRSR